MNWLKELALRRAIKKLENGSTSAKLAAIEELATYPNDQRAMTEIVGLLVYGAGEVRTAAHRALVKAGNGAVNALSRRMEFDGALVAFKTLAEIIGQREAARRMFAAHPDKFDSVNKKLIDSIQATTPGDFLEALEYCVDEKVPEEVKQRVIEIFGTLGTPRAVEVLIRLLKPENTFSMYLMSITRSLGNIGGPEVNAVLAQLFKNKRADFRSRECAADALGKARCPEPLIEALGDEDCKIRNVAAWALPSIHDLAICVPALTRALDDPDSGVRITAVAGLAKLECNEGVTVLQGLLDHSDEKVQLDAAIYLDRLGDAKGKKYLQEREARRLEKRSPIDAACDAARHGDLEKVRVWTQSGNDTNAKDSNGDTLLISAAQGLPTSDPRPLFRHDVVIYLLQRGADPNATGDQGLRALSWAVFKGRLDLIQALLNHGARTDAPAPGSHTVLTWARDHGAWETVELLQQTR
jgi:HEAT repeat protein